VKITADTITDEQIRELRTWAKGAPRSGVIETMRERLGLIETCAIALGETKIQARDDVREFARARCAEILNARKAGSR
jgi:hypothetical protein